MRTPAALLAGTALAGTAVLLGRAVRWRAG